MIRTRVGYAGGKKENPTYRDLGDQYLDETQKKRTTRHLLGRLKKLGYEVTLNAA